MSNPTTHDPAQRWPLRSRPVGGFDGSEADAREVRMVEGVAGGLGALVRGAARRKKGGGTLPAVEYRSSDRRIDATALVEYQKLCGFRVSSLAPSTFVHVQTFPLSMAVMGAAEFPFPLLGLVHVNNRITQVRPLEAAETFELRVWAERLRDHPAGQQVDIEAQASVDGEVIWLGTSTYLHRSGPAPTRGPRPAAAAAPAASAYWNLPAALGRRYAAVSGDRNPIHLSRLSARAFGFPRAIAHGMWMNARVLGAMEPRLPAGYTVDVAFKTPAFLPSRVAFTAEPTAEGWALGLRNATTDKPHLAAKVNS